MNRKTVKGSAVRARRTKSITGPKSGNSFAYWNSDFSFTTEQEEDIILECWSREAARGLAGRYLQEVTEIIRCWQNAPAEVYDPDAGRLREHATKIKDASDTLRAALYDPPDEVGLPLSMRIHERLYLANIHPQHNEALPYLRACAGEDSVGYRELIEVMDCWLDMLSDAAGELAKVKGKTGTKQGKQKALIRQLAVAYERRFGELPSAANQRASAPESASNFRRLMKKLSDILGVKFGARIIGEVLTELKQQEAVTIKPKY